MVYDLPDYSKKVIVVYEGTITGGLVQVDHRQIKGLTLKDPYVALCIPSSIENPALAYDAVNDRFKVTIEDWDIASIVADISDKWARQLGLVDISRVLGAAMSHSNPLYTRLTDGSAFIDPRDISDRAARLLGIVYGNKGQLQQRTTSLDLLVQLMSAGAEIDPRSIRALTSSDVVTAQQTTRTSMTVKPEREDLISKGGVVSPNGAGVEIVAPSDTLKVKLYDAGYEALAAGLHYFYFGTDTTATTKRFLTRQTIGAILKTVIQPRVSAAGDGLYLYSAVEETDMPYDVGYVQE